MPLEIPKNPYITVKVIPKSNKTEFVEILEDGNGEKIIKIRLKAVPEKNKANIELINFLSKELKLPKNNITIISGKTERLKLIKLQWI